MPTRRAVASLLGVALTGVLAAATTAPDPDLSWYVASVCPDDGIACTDERVVYGDCRHIPDPTACPDDGIFCNGIESCRPEQGGCVSSGTPCGGVTPTCDETADLCLASNRGESGPKPGPLAASPAGHRRRRVVIWL